MLNINGLFGEFGKIEDNSVALTISGQIAVKRNENEYIRYDKENEVMENQLDMVMKDASDFIYIFPVNEVNVDDIIKYQQTYYQILDILGNGSLKAVNIKNGSKKTILKETNLLGLSFYYKVTCLFTDNETKNNTLNGIDPMMLMMMTDEDGDKDSMLPLMMMMGGLNNKQSKSTNSETNNTPTMNPMMLMMMMNKSDKKDGKSSSMKDLMMMQMMSGQNSQMNPMMLMMMNDGKMDMKTMMMMQMMNGGNMFGNKTTSVKTETIDTVNNINLK